MSLLGGPTRPPVWKFLNRSLSFGSFFLLSYAISNPDGERPIYEVSVPYRNKEFVIVDAYSSRYNWPAHQQQQQQQQQKEEKRERLPTAVAAKLEVQNRNIELALKNKARYYQLNQGYICSRILRPSATSPVSLGAENKTPSDDSTISTNAGAASTTGGLICPRARAGALVPWFVVSSWAETSHRQLADDRPEGLRLDFALARSLDADNFESTPRPPPAMAPALYKIVVDDSKFYPG
eukprot:GHVT01059089.1.p1 GENE.GHVT01059089.1~~GHVT01059089.1.p1  ORF type:complete len:237 (-),score=61.02 GHVT01059089.1:301-1011(-)